MTRDEVLKMPAGQEMDALVATEIFQHEVTKDGRGYWEGFTTLDNYTRSILSAWKVSERMIGNGFSFAINHTGAQWRAMFVPHTTKPPFWFLTHNFKMPKPEYTAWEDTAPLAICRAALLAIDPK